MVSKDIISGYNLKYPNQTRIGLILIRATEEMLNLSILNPSLESMDALQQASLTLFYNFEGYGSIENTKRLKELLDSNENKILQFKRRRRVPIRHKQELMKDIRETYAKILALTNSCGLGLPISKGINDYEKNIERILTR